MSYEALLNTPLNQATKAVAELRNALYDMASVYSANDNFEMSGKMVNARDSLRVVEQLLKQVDQDQIDGLASQLQSLQDEGIY